MMTDLASPFQDASNLSLAQHLQILEGLIQIIGSVLHQPIIFCPFLRSHSDFVVFRKDKQRVLSLYQFSQWDFLVEMHGGVVLISSSFSSGFKQFVNACDLSCELVMEVIGFGVLEDVLGIEELLVDKGWGKIASTDHEDFCRGESRSLWLGCLDPLEEFLEDPH